jgi:hypothetical protein
MTGIFLTFLSLVISCTKIDMELERQRVLINVSLMSEMKQTQPSRSQRTNFFLKQCITVTVTTRNKEEQFDGRVMLSATCLLQVRTAPFFVAEPDSFLPVLVNEKALTQTNEHLGDRDTRKNTPTQRLSLFQVDNTTTCSLAQQLANTIYYSVQETVLSPVRKCNTRFLIILILLRTVMACSENDFHRQIAAMNRQVYRKRGSGLPSSVDDFMPLTPRKKRKTEVTEEASAVSFNAGAAALLTVNGNPLPDPKGNDNPTAFLRELFRAMYGISLQVTPATQLENFFQPSTEEQMAAYTTDIVSLARDNQIDKIKQLCDDTGFEAIRCKNQFGESLLHLACRRGFKESVQFFLEQGQLPTRISDDCGRNPLHDACWNATPQLEICQQLLERDPALFLVSDGRGFTPFDYARAQHWGIWKQFLLDNRHLLQKLADDAETLDRFTECGKKDSSS